LKKKKTIENSFGGYTGDGGFERLADCYKLPAGSIIWEEVEIRGSLPMTGLKSKKIFFF